jgi:hypothetical protein
MKNNLFFVFPVTNNDFKSLLGIIKNIVQQPCQFHKRHTIVLAFQEVLKNTFIPPLKSLIHNYTNHCLFILTGKVPFSIAQSSIAINCSISCNDILSFIGLEKDVPLLDCKCPMELCAKLEGLSLHTPSVIQKTLSEIIKDKKYEQIKSFSYKILASGIPIQLFCKYLLDVVPQHINIICQFELNVLNSTKPIFHLETLLLKICLDGN